jgi:hypothetical protein
MFAIGAHLTASALFRAGPLGPYPAGYPKRSAGGQVICLGFPLPFGRRRSLFGHPSPAGELGPPHGRLTEPQARTSTGFPRSAHASCDRGGRPLCPGDDGAHPGPEPLPGRRLPLRNGLVPAPDRTSHRRDLVDEASTKGSHVFARPVFPSPVAARMERAALGLEPRASHPADQEPTTHAEAGTGHRARTWNYSLNSHWSISNPVVLS